MKWIFATLLLLSFAQTGFADRIPTMIMKELSYEDHGTVLKGYCAFKSSAKPLKVVLILPEWWGCGEYVRMRARKLADAGYFAFAIDIYGNGQIAQTPEEAGKLAGPYYQDPAKANARIQAAIDFVKTQRGADTTNISAIGYCFGGGLLLNAARMGMDLKKVVSFHGSLKGVDAKPGQVKAQILVCHGLSDQFISKAEVLHFHQNMKDAKAIYGFISYSKATHAFTNPDATATGKKFNLPISYNAAADKKSWKDMLVFLRK
jgi:dienelactone hydrolase